MPELEPATVERFRNDVQALIETQHMRLGLAVSGGGDSLALLLLAHAAFPQQITVATVDHQLRPEAADEARFVAQICAARGIPHTILLPDQPITGSLQSSARAVRYALLARWAEVESCTWIATAHHVDDQAETLLMRLNRGAGVAGLAGVRRMNGQIIRPLLGWRRAALASVVAHAGITPVDDPSNYDLYYDRVRVRNALATADWIAPERLAASAHYLAQANTALEWSSSALAKERLIFSTDSVKMDPSLLPRELRRRLVLIALRHLDPEITPRGAALAELISALERAEKRTLGAVQISGGVTWRFKCAAPRRKNIA